MTLESLSKQIEIVQCLGFFYLNLEIKIELRIGHPFKLNGLPCGVYYEQYFFFFFSHASSCAAVNYIFADHCRSLVPARRVPSPIGGGCAPVGDGVRRVGPVGVCITVHGSAHASVSQFAAERGGGDPVSSCCWHSLPFGRRPGKCGAALLYGANRNRKRIL